MSAHSVGTAATQWIGLVGLGRRRRRHCGAVVRLFLAGAVLAVATFIAPGVASATPPANGERPTLSGDAVVGSTLYATAGRWSGVPAPTYSYRWQYQASTATGRTSPVRPVRRTRSSPADLGTEIRVNVTATNSDGSAEQISAVDRHGQEPAGDAGGPRRPRRRTRSEHSRQQPGGQRRRPVSSASTSAGPRASRAGQPDAGDEQRRCARRAARGP